MVYTQDHLQQQKVSHKGRKIAVSLLNLYYKPHIMRQMYCTCLITIVISCAPAHSVQVDFRDVEARTLAERRRQEEKQQRLERIYKGKLEKAKEDMEGKAFFTVLLF